MKNVALLKQRQRLDWLFARVAAATGGDMEMQAEWAKYICVQIAGYVENIVRELYSDYVSNKAHPAVASYAQSQLESIQNPKSNRILEIAADFDLGWKDRLEAFISAEGRKEAIDTIMTNRHLIAHGRTCNISIVRVKEYYDRINKVADFIAVSLDTGI